MFSIISDAVQHHHHVIHLRVSSRGVITPTLRVITTVIAEISKFFIWHNHVLKSILRHNRRVCYCAEVRSPTTSMVLAARKAKKH